MQKIGLLNEPKLFEDMDISNSLWPGPFVKNLLNTSLNIKFKGHLIIVIECCLEAMHPPL